MRRPEPNIDSSRVYALLGPTNTGKTHRAIERMLEFDSGMMGLPLRLLAREVYDRVSARLGEQAVALVTGEEKRAPPGARYWICTVEAMPRDLRVEFVGIDEIQLVGHPERGHVFTDRMLFWRGSRETWFLGAKAAERLVRTAVPEVEVKLLPRLSKLTHIGQSSLRTLPRRSAVVAFNMQQVYELADAITARRGGAAVVLGALSPRVRNAQVSLYQAGEVDFLVATDAIGMGLNLDIDHVALAGLRKFDGFEIRDLEPAELGQIVGRAGRYLRDGSFGTLSPEPELAPRLAQQLEEHRFASLKLAYYRNSELDFDSTQRLLESLSEKPPSFAATTDPRASSSPNFTAAPDADDILVLQVLVKRPEVIARVNAREAVQTLWDVCRVPNFEKRIPEHQAERLLPIFVTLVDRGRLPAAWVERELSRLARPEGDLHQLMDRLAQVRTWTYVSHQSGWLERASELRIRARDIEDQLGDLLHERLRERFVRERKGRAYGRAASAATFTLSASPFAKLREHPMFDAHGQPGARSEQGFVEALVEAPFEALVWNARGELSFEGEVVARLTAGPSVLRPQFKLVLPDWVPPGSRSRIERRVTAHLKDSLADYLSALQPLSVPSAPLRGLLYQLTQGLGTVLRTQAAPLLAALSPSDKLQLSELGVVLGQRAIYASDLLSQSRRTLRMALARLTAPDVRAFDASYLAMRDEVYWPRSRGSEAELLLWLGMVPLSRIAVRADVLERLLARINTKNLDERPAEIALVLGVSADVAAQLAQELKPKKRKRSRRRAPRPTE